METQIFKAMLRAIKDRVILREIKPPRQTESGLYRPDTAEDGPIMKASVVSVGSKVQDLKTGDVVLVEKGHRVTVDFQEYILTNVAYVLAVVEE